jgi:GT2 family glycosyltransferase
MIAVTVGIPTLNGPDRLGRALEAIRAYTAWDRLARTTRIKLLVCDDGSRPETLDANRAVVCDMHKELQARAGLEMIMNTEREGVAASWNKLVRHQDCDVAVLLNDDVEVSAHWLDVLIYSVLENPRAGMVGLNSYVALTRAQHRAAYPELLEHVAQPRLDYCEARLMSQSGNLLASNGSAFAFRRECYGLVGGFDERYKCFNEELDFGVALRFEGYEHFIASYPILYHMGGATTSDIRNIDAQVELIRSRTAFHKKWRMSPGRLRTQLAATPKRDDLPLKQWSTALANVED